MSDRQPTERQRYWLDHLVAWQRGNLSLKAYAASVSISRASLYGWKARLTRMGLWDRSAPTPSPRFQRIAMAREVGNGCRIHLPNGITVELDPDCDLERLSDLVHALIAR